MLFHIIFMQSIEPITLAHTFTVATRQSVGFSLIAVAVNIELALLSITTFKHNLSSVEDGGRELLPLLPTSSATPPSFVEFLNSRDYCYESFDHSVI